MNQLQPQPAEEPRRPTFSSQMLDALRRGEEFTGPQAYERWGVWSVSSLINNLREKGYQIDSKREPETGRAVYFMMRKRQLKDVRYWPTYRIGL